MCKSCFYKTVFLLLSLLPVTKPKRSYSLLEERLFLELASTLLRIASWTNCFLLCIFKILNQAEVPRPKHMCVVCGKENYFYIFQKINFWWMRWTLVEEWQNFSVFLFIVKFFQSSSKNLACHRRILMITFRFFCFFLFHGWINPFKNRIYIYNRRQFLKTENRKWIGNIWRITNLCANFRKRKCKTYKYIKRTKYKKNP